MSNNRTKSYFEKIRYLFPEVDQAGACQGHGLMMMQGLVSERFSETVEHIKAILYGVRFEGVKISLDHMKDIAKEFGLEIEVSKILSNNELEEKRLLEYKRENKLIAPPSDHPKINLIEKVCELLKKLELPDLIPYIQKQTESKTPDTHEEYISLEHLKQLMDYAWALNEALVQKFKMDKDSYHALHKKFPFIQELIQLETYLTSLSAYQSPQRFISLFEKHNRPTTQVVDPLFSFFSPVCLDAKEQGPGICHLLSFEVSAANAKHIQEYFASLSREIHNSSLSETILPLCITLHTLGHLISIGYDKKKRKWLLAELRQLPYREISEEDIGVEIINALVTQNKCSFSSTNSQASLFYYLEKEIWLLINKKVSSTPIEEKHPETEKIIQKLNPSDILPTFAFCPVINVYTSIKAKERVKPVIDHWEVALTSRQLKSAILYQDIERVKYLLTKKFDPNLLLNKDESLLSELTRLGTAEIRQKNIEILKLLIEAGAETDFNRYSDIEEAPLYLLAKSNGTEEMREILKKHHEKCWPRKMHLIG